MYWSLIDSDDTSLFELEHELGITLGDALDLAIGGAAHLAVRAIGFAPARKRATLARILPRALRLVVAPAHVRARALTAHLGRPIAAGVGREPRTEPVLAPVSVAAAKRP